MLLGAQVTGTGRCREVVFWLMVSCSVVEGAGAVASVTSVRGVGSVGSVIVGSSVTFSVSGVLGTGEVGTTSVWGLIDTSQTPNWQTIAA